MSKRESIIRYKLLYTVLILLVYLVGRELPLYGVDTSDYLNRSMDAENLLMQVVGGDSYQSSLFALGVSPYMISSILVQIMVAYKKASSKARISQKRISMLTAVFTLIMALLQAMLHVGELSFFPEGAALYLAQSVAVTEMVAGVMLIVWLVARNKKYGIGGQTALIFVNIVDSLAAMMKGYSIRHLGLPLLVSAVAMFLMIIMENAEKRIPVQRISIHNIYADKNYLAVKLNPIGIMPLIFSTAFFSLPS